MHSRQVNVSADRVKPAYVLGLNTTPASHQPSPAAIHRNLLRLGLHRLLAQDALYASQLGSPPKLSSPQGGVMWGHPHCSSPSSIQFSARQHSNTHSLSLLSFSLGNPSPLTAPNQVQFPITAPQQEYSFYLPRLPNLPTNQWQGRSNSKKSV